MRCVAFSLDLGSEALTVASDVSGLQLEIDGYFGAIGDQLRCCQGACKYSSLQSNM